MNIRARSFLGFLLLVAIAFGATIALCKIARAELSLWWLLVVIPVAAVIVIAADFLEPLWFRILDRSDRD